MSNLYINVFRTHFIFSSQTRKQMYKKKADSVVEIHLCFLDVCAFFLHIQQQETFKDVQQLSHCFCNDIVNRD
jgi:5-methylthioribose kinase